MEKRKNREEVRRREKKREEERILAKKEEITHWLVSPFVAPVFRFSRYGCFEGAYKSANHFLVAPSHPF